MPDAYSRWRDIAVGALVATVLFSIGRRLLVVILAITNADSLYGAAGAFVVLLIWVYFSAQILLFGAEFTWLYALRHGRPIRPNRMAEFVMLVEEMKTADDGRPAAGS
jgi:membrane protein